MKKNTVKLNEAALRKIVAESVKRIVKEADKADIDKAWQEEIKRGEFGPESLDMLRSDIEDLVSQWRWKADRIINDYIAIGYEKYVEQELSKCRIKDFSEWYKDTYHETLDELIKKVRAHRKAYSMYIPRNDVAESVKRVLKENLGIRKYESELRNAINIITSNLECESPKIGKNNNGYSYCDIELPSVSMSLRLYCYNEETGELGARLDDEYGTNMYDYVSAAQGAPLGYITDRTGRGLAQKIVSDVRSIEKDLDNDLYGEDDINEGINELSPEFVGHAGDVARNQGRWQQAKNFSDYESTLLDKEYKEFMGDGVVNVDKDSITYCPYNNAQVTLDAIGYAADGQNSVNIAKKGLPPYMRTANPKLARKIASWWNRFNILGDDKVLSYLSDWHTFIV